MLSPYDVYCLYLAIKQHFTNPSYDFFKYSGKIRASKDTFNKRKDKYFFEKLSRKKQEKEIIDYFVSNFVATSDPSKLWIGELREKGEDNYINWKGRVQSLSYNFSQDLSKVTETEHLYEALVPKTGAHPKIIKSYLSGKITLETLIILDDITSFLSKLELSDDPVMSLVVSKIRKYKPFLFYDKKFFVDKIRQLVLQ